MFYNVKRAMQWEKKSMYFYLTICTVLVKHAINKSYLQLGLKIMN